MLKTRITTNSSRISRNNYIPLFASPSFSPTMVGLKTGKGIIKLFRVWKHFVSRAKQLVSARETELNCPLC